MFVEQRWRAEARLLRYFDASLDLLATADASGHFVRVNPAWQTALGYTPAELMARPFIEFVLPEDRQATLEQATRLRQQKRDLVRFRNRYVAADGEVHWLEWNVHAPTRDGLSHATARDITIQVAAERQLENSAATLERMVAARTAELDEARAETLARLARAGEFRDDNTFQHTERVGATSAEVAAWLGLDGEQVALIREAAPLHDIGKLAISDTILLKQGPLTDAERSEMQTHAEIGARLLGGSNSPVLEMASTIAASHHERWDGGGYPAGLSGESIPLWGRIVAVADVFDALTHDRPYKRAWPAARAIGEIRRQSGRHFDPRVVEAFLATRRRSAAPAPQMRGARPAATASRAA
jgi:PAS domain S-box-containing protein/putative nucleotidyltransferase with HDIG domain